MDAKKSVIIFNLVMLLLKRKSISESKNITLGNKKKRCWKTPPDYGRTRH